MVATVPRVAALPVLVSIAVFAASCLVPDTGDARILEGFKEIGIVGGFYSISTGDDRPRQAAMTLSTDFGAFPHRRHEAGFRFGFTAIEGGTANALVGGFYSLHPFPDEVGVPFLTIAGGAALGGVPVIDPLFEEQSGASPFISFGGGVKSFITPSAAFKVEYRYDRYAIDEGRYDRHAVLLGMSVFLIPQEARSRVGYEP